MAPHLPSGPTWRLGARRASFIVFVVMLVAGAVATTMRPSTATQAVSLRIPLPRPAPSSPARAGPKAKPPPTSSSPPPATPARSRSPAPDDELGRLAAFGEPIYCGAGTKPLVALTFDDGPGALTPIALRRLHRFHAKATFFLVGKLLDEPALAAIARREAAAGMAFGDHTWDHVMMTGRSASFYDQEIGRTARAISQATGRRARLFRPPFEAHDRNLDAWVRAQGMLQVMWSTDSLDSQGATTRRVFRAVRRGIRPGAIILLHDNRGTTETALREILRRVKARGLKAVTVPELLTRDPPTRTQLRDHTCS
jgi:peptidoglycan/xylan/chitin deacetylase (PgdA/CDA1 family)